jgi:hypothetical protein
VYFAKSPYSPKMELRSVYQGPPALMKMGLPTHGSSSHVSKFLKVSSTLVGLRDQRVKFGIALKRKDFFSFFFHINYNFIYIFFST